MAPSTAGATSPPLSPLAHAPRSVHVRTGEEVAVKIVDLEEACAASLGIARRSPDAPPLEARTR